LSAVPVCECGGRTVLRGVRRGTRLIAEI
jgi:hypothetical protein